MAWPVEGYGTLFKYLLGINLHTVFVLHNTTEAQFAEQIRTRLEHAQPQMRNYKNNDNVLFEIQECDFLIEVFTSTKLPTVFWQPNSDEVVNE